MEPNTKPPAEVPPNENPQKSRKLELKKAAIKTLKETDAFIKKFQSVFLIVVFMIALIALVFSLWRSNESLWIEEGFIETCQAEFDKDSLDKSCVKTLLKLREVREAPDISEHLKHIESRLTTSVKSNTKEFFEQKVNEGVGTVREDNRKTFENWKDGMDEKVSATEYLTKIALIVPRPEKQFNKNEEQNLKEWAGSSPRYKDLLSNSETALKSFTKLEINEDVLTELKLLYSDSKGFKGNGNKSGFRAKIENLEKDDGPFFKVLNEIMQEQNKLHKNVDSLTQRYYTVQAEQDVHGEKGPIYMGFIGVAVISVTSLFLSLYNKSSNSERRQYQPVYQRDNSPERGRRPQISSSMTPSIRTSSILNGVQRKRCENVICIVSFYKETQRTHQRLLNSVLYGTRFEHKRVELVIINKHEQIKDIPGAKVYIVFVDYNQRHVILENPDLGLGDLRLTTVQGCRKIGGQVAVLYVGDDGSRHIPHGQLFNSSLTSVYQHEELRTLNEQQRFFSTYQTLTSDQIRLLQQFLMQNVNST